jgi:uncharacterized damage-inducible protein DinB
MRHADIAILVDYMYWVDWRILTSANELTPEQFAAPTEVTTRDLRATLVHELDVESSWRLHLQGRGDEDQAELDPTDYRDLPSLEDRWRQDEAEMRAWIETLTDEALATTVESDLSGEVRPRWQFIVHIVMHSIQQASDAATLLTLADASPGELSFGEYLS